MFFIRSVQKAVCEADLFLNNSEITAIQVIRCNSGNRPATQAAFPSALNQQSAQPDTASTAEYRTEPIHLHIPQRITAAWPGGEEREKGRRPSLTPSASPSRKPAHAKVSPRKEKIQLTAVRNSRKKCQLIRMPQHPYPTGRSSTVRKLRKEEPDHFLLQEVRSPVTPHYPSRVLAPWQAYKSEQPVQDL